MFSIGDLVVHPMHGAGMIRDIVQEKIEGVVKEYYLFEMPLGGLDLKVPVAKAETIGIRSLISRDEAEALLSAIPALEVENNTNWNKRYQENVVRLKSGNLDEGARVAKGLMQRESQRGLSTGERKMLLSAKQIILSELVLVTACAYEDAEKRLDSAMKEQA